MQALSQCWYVCILAGTTANALDHFLVTFFRPHEVRLLLKVHMRNNGVFHDNIVVSEVNPSSLPSGTALLGSRVCCMTSKGQRQVP